jgi:hypothetical protein
LIKSSLIIVENTAFGIRVARLAVTLELSALAGKSDATLLLVLAGPPRQFGDALWDGDR